MSTSSKASGSQKAKVADSTSIESYPELVNFDICALRQQIIGNAALAYPMLAEQASEHSDAPLSPGQMFNIVMHSNKVEQGMLGDAGRVAYVARLVTMDSTMPHLINQGKSSLSFEMALKELLTTASQDVAARTKSITQFESRIPDGAEHL